jgi:hypothetical protein
VPGLDDFFGNDFILQDSVSEDTVGSQTYFGGCVAIEMVGFTDKSF